MASDDFIYACLLFSSIPLGLLVRVQSLSKAKEVLCTFSGILIILLVCRQHALHSAVLTIGNTVICMLMRNRYVHIYSFLWCFSYLFFFRTCHWYGFPRASPHSNAVQLLITLRLVGLAGEIHQSDGLKQKLTQLADREDDDELSKIKLEYRYRVIDTSLWRIISYSYCYIGALTGPFYTCRTYQDMINSSVEKRRSLPLLTDLRLRLRALPVCATIFLFTTSYISVQVAKEDEFFENTSFLYRYGYVCILCFVLFKTRFYCAWILAECMCVTAGLGAYPKQAENKPGGGPTNLEALEDRETAERTGKAVEYDFKTITNILPYETEFATTIRSSIRTWNMTVQWWLAVHVYKKIPIEERTVRGIILMVISAYWHGVHPGWYATFLSAPFLLLAEDSMTSGLRLRITSPTALYIYDCMASFIRMRFFEYFAVGAHFLHYSHIMRYWSSIYFCGHFVLIFLLFLGQILCHFPATKNVIKSE